MIQVNINFPAYDARVKGKPWIYRLEKWPSGGKFSGGSVTWGLWLGTSCDGGIASLACVPGDVIRYGQKNRAYKGTSDAPWWFVNEDGSLTQISKEEAREVVGKYREVNS